MAVSSHARKLLNRPWVGGAAWVVAATAIVVAVWGELIHVPHGNASSALGYTRDDVTLYEGEVSTFAVTKEVLPGGTFYEAKLALSTGAPQIIFMHYAWRHLPAVEVGDHIRIWTACSNGCDYSATEALKLLSPRTSAVSDVAQYHNVDFTPESGGWQAFARTAGPVAGVVLGLLVCLYLLLVERSRLVPLAVASAMVAVTLTPLAFAADQGNAAVAWLAVVSALVAMVLGLLIWLAGRRAQVRVSPFVIVATLIGATVSVAVPGLLVLGSIARGFMFA